MATVTVNGVTYTDDDNATTGLANGGHRTRLVPMFGNAVTDLLAKQTASAASAAAAVVSKDAAATSALTAANAPGTSGTSVTSLTIGVATHALTTQTAKAWVVGQLVSIARTAAPATTRMFGIIAEYVSATGAMSVTVAAGNTAGSGAFTDWTISLSGPAGALIGTAAGTIDLLTGAAIASAATVNLDTATGNRVHITGTVAITAWTLTRGPRTVIFDAAVPLTYHATTNRLNSGATSYTTTAGDTADIYSDGATVFVNITKVAGTPVVAGDSTLAFTPQTKSADYTFVLGDAGDIFVHPAADTAVRTWTIPANASVAFPIGTTIMLVVVQGAGSVKLKIVSDTLRSVDGTTSTKQLLGNRQNLLTKVTATEWFINTGSNTAEFASALALGMGLTPFVAAYSWTSLGFGTRFANPATLPAGACNGVVFSPAGTEIAVGHGGTPFVTAYPWSASGFGAKFVDPATLPAGTGYGIDISPAGTEIAVTHATTPFVTAYPWTSSGFGVKFANPATLPAGTAVGSGFHPLGNAFAIAHDVTPFVTAYPWTSSGFGVKFADPATLPAGQGFAVVFSPAGTEIAIAHAVTPFVTAYPWSASGFGAKFANPATLPAGAGYGAAFSPAGTEIAIAHDVTPFVTAYPWTSSGFGVKFANPATLPAGIGNFTPAFSQVGTELAIPHTTTPFVTAYPWTSSGFGVKFANPATLPEGNGQAAAFLNI